jgi:hypothetical protein
MKPVLWRRTLSRTLLDALVSVVPPKITVPELTESSPAAHCMRVVFPAPDGPIIAVNSPVLKATDTSFNTRTGSSRVP